MESFKCDKGVKLEDCELAILRMAVDKAEEIEGISIVNSPEVKKIITIVEEFLKKRKLIAYGGTAINSILPIEDQFYNKNTEIPDYDFFSPTAHQDAIDLADIYYNKGFQEVEAKNGIHEGTYKVFVNFIPVADITFLNKNIFQVLKRDAICKKGILYAPPNFLRMSMYLELSRPAGDVSRWEKVLKRITLLNKNFPLKANDCWKIDFQRKMGNKENINIYDVVKNTFIKEKVVFFGGYAISLYSKYMPRKLRHQFKKNPDFDVLSIHPLKTAELLKRELQNVGIHNVSIIKRKSIGEIISLHYEIKVEKDTIAFIYEPMACHSYNVININNQSIKIATIDTMLSFYLAFLYSNKEYYDVDRILCMSQYLFKVQQHNRLEQKGLLKRFSIECYGHQETLEEIRAKKNKLFLSLKNKKNTKEFQLHFMRYRPIEKQNTFLQNNKVTKSQHNYTQNNKVTKSQHNYTQNNKVTKSQHNYTQNKITRKRGRGGLFI
jgi:hypothetical protein